MPRSAAIFFGIVLVAFSIGFNTMRYPVVWDMVGPATAGESTPAEVAPQNKTVHGEVREGESPIFVDHRCATVPAKIGTVPAEKPAIENPPPIKANETADSDQPERLAPLEPVARMPSSNARANDVAVGTDIRRLPPVDQITPNPNSRNAARYSNGSIPVYPSTGF